MTTYPWIDVPALAGHLEVDFESAKALLIDLYMHVDARNAFNTKGLDLPCHRGCDACCHESVFLTPLEFLVVWDWAQRELDDATRTTMIERGLALYQQHREVIDALEEPPPEGEQDHFSLVKDLAFRCPLLGDDGACGVYPARELYARLFGCSFNSQGGVYGCHLVGAHLADKTVTLLRADATADKLNELPLTHKRQVYPYYLQWLFG